MPDKINVLFLARSKPERVDEFLAAAKKMMAVAKEEDGCRSFAYHRNKKDPLQFFLYESWRDRTALDGHLEGLRSMFGPCDEGQRLPAKLLAFWDEWSAEMYGIVIDL